MDYATQRKNMVESQVRPSDVTDRRILRAMLDVPRELFVAKSQQATAYMDGAIKVETVAGGKRTMLAARTLAKMLQAADIEPGAHVLIIGGVGGYTAAIAQQLAKSVVLLEPDAAEAAAASDALRAAGVEAVTAVSGPLPEGWAEAAPYDAIVVEGAVGDLSESLLEQLKDRGRLVAILAQDGTLRAVRCVRVEGAYGMSAVFDATADYLPGFEPVAQFAF